MESGGWLTRSIITKLIITFILTVAAGPPGAALASVADCIVLYKGSPQSGLSSLSGNKIVILGVAIATALGIMSADRIWEIVKGLAEKVKSRFQIVERPRELTYH